MRKIMFNDKFGLTDAVLKGTKTMTRRLINLPEDVQIMSHFYDDENKTVECITSDGSVLDLEPAYWFDDIVAVAQNLKDMGYNPRATPDGAIWGLDHTAAWRNKMFVCTSQCIHKIQITDLKVEKLQDISDEDCLKEGIVKLGFLTYSYKDKPIEKELFRSPQYAFATLIDKVSGKGTWKRNPYAFAYSFKLVK